MRVSAVLLSVTTLALQATIGLAQNPSASAPPASSAITIVESAGETGDAKLGGQVFFRGGVGILFGPSRAGQVFTDTLAAGAANSGTVGFNTGFGFNLPLMRDPLLNNRVLAEVLMDFTQFSNRAVVTTTSALLGAPAVSNVSVSRMSVVGAPKYQLNSEGRLCPWLIPVGMAMFVDSPPSNDATYLDIGLHFGAGVDLRLTKSLSLGVDWRYNWKSNLDGSGAQNWMTAGGYIGFNY